MRPTVVTGSMELAAPIEEVYDFLGDVDNEADWNPDLKSIRRVDGRTGLQPGAEWQGNYGGIGRMRIRLDECQRPRRLVFDGVGSRMDMRFTFELAPDGERTQVSARGELTAKGLMRLASPLLGPMMRRTLAQRPAQMQGALSRRRATSPDAS